MSILIILIKKLCVGCDFTDIELHQSIIEVTSDQFTLIPSILQLFDYRRRIISIIEIERIDNGILDDVNTGTNKTTIKK